MKKEINKILKKYENIEFTHQEDKQVFLDFLEKISGEITEKDWLDSFLDILEDSFLSNSKFDPTIIYNPLNFLDALFENDLSGEKFDTDEVEQSLIKFKDFENYMQGNMNRKDFLEKKYEIKINIFDKDTLGFGGNMTAAGLSKPLQIVAIKRLEKLLKFYPLIFIKNIKLDQIVVAAYYIQKDHLGRTMKLGGFETQNDNNIYLSANSLKHSFDHEIYHQAMQYYDDYDQWSVIRESQNTNFKYENSGKVSRGFARDYGKMNISEDQATIAESLVMNYKWIMHRAKNDIELRKKIDLVKKAYYELSDGTMDSEFWLR